MNLHQHKSFIFNSIRRKTFNTNFWEVDFKGFTKQIGRLIKFETDFTLYLFTRHFVSDVPPFGLKPRHQVNLLLLIAAMFSEIFPKEQVTLVNGDGAAFSKLPFDHLIFTGSKAVGRSVMKAASENLVPLTLELGGKSPVIISKGYSLEKAASRIVYGKLLSAGQTCIAPDYALVHETEVNAFIKAYDHHVKLAYPEGPTGDDYTSIVNDQQYAILKKLLNDAEAHGAKIIEVEGKKDY
nr:aldehyde dehydrogenase family protein [Chitinophaga sp. CF118]